ncbi:MAG: M48 family metalloprotease, partial [Actinomycetaceae bacterium]|nr:M48 family metalloprotease [Actinomycetaceae bacterium]
MLKTKRVTQNNIKAAFLLGLMVAFVMAIGWVFSYMLQNSVFIIISLVVSLGGIAYSYWNSASLALRSMNAREVTSHEMPQLYRIVHELSSRAGQPMPQLYVAHTSSPNAFATGRDPKHAAVCVTTGILDILDERELRGVLGHELSHVYNRDILTSSIAAGLASIITSIAQMAMYASMFSGRNDERNNGGIVGGLLMSFLAPIAASLVQMAISRTCEYEADHDGAELTADPLALASALKKISAGAQAAPMPQKQEIRNVSAAMITNPFGSLKD